VGRRLPLSLFQELTFPITWRDSPYLRHTDQCLAIYVSILSTVTAGDPISGSCSGSSTEALVRLVATWGKRLRAFPPQPNLPHRWFGIERMSPGPYWLADPRSGLHSFPIPAGPNEAEQVILHLVKRLDRREQASRPATYADVTIDA
jgi:hypothetical protein